MHKTRVVVLLAAAGALMCASFVPGGLVTANAASSQADIEMYPTAVHAAKGTAGPLSTAQCEATYGFACYGATQIQNAYDLPRLYKNGTTGKGQTIVIVDSFGSPTISHDLDVFDAQYGLPKPNLTIIQPAGSVPQYKENANFEGWAGETTLDVEYAHTVAPGANILLVETPFSENEGTSGFPAIVKAEKYVLDHNLGTVISQSFSATEQTFPSDQALLKLRSAYVEAQAKGVTVLAASGDSGAADTKLDLVTYYTHPVTSWPDSDPLVTGVGGTQLHLGQTAAQRTPDTVWNDTYNTTLQQAFFGNDGPNPLAGGGGKSVVFSRPSYQNSVKSVVGGARGVPDISMSGACNGSVNTYQSFPGQPAGWYPTCGTSEATPLFAGIVALAAQVAGHPIGLINPALYAMSAAHATGIVDVTEGNNTVGFEQGGHDYTVTGATAGPGYDLASGVGTVNGLKFVPQLAAAAG